MRKKAIRNGSNILHQNHDHHVLQLQRTEVPWKHYFLDGKVRARQISAASSNDIAAFVPLFLGKSEVYCFSNQWSLILQEERKSVY